MREPDALLTLGTACVTPYSVLMALGALLACLLTLALCRKSIGTERGVSLCACTVAGAVLGGHIVYVLCMFNYFASGLMLVFKPWLGGYTLYGAVLGGLCAALVYARVTKQSFATLCDLLAPGAALAIAIGRAAEAFTDQGLGEYVDAEALQFFPIAVRDSYGDFRMPVFAWEALAALVILAVVLSMRGKRRAGERAEVMLTLLGVSQIFLEQIRRDDYLRFGFVRFTQLAAIIVIAAVMALRILRSIRGGGAGAWTYVRTALLLVGVLVVIFIEFAFEKPQFMPVLRVCIALLGALCMASLLTLRGRGAVVGALCALIAALTVAVLVPLHMALVWENDLLLGVMALALAAIAATVLIDGKRAE